MNSYLGIHLGRFSLSAQLIGEDGTPLLCEKRRFPSGSELGLVLLNLLEQWSTHEAWKALRGFGLGLEKSQRIHLPQALLREHLPETASFIYLPAPQAILLGALPQSPGLLLSMGNDLRLATTDSTHVYREFRLQEGGGAWWVAELQRISEHSPKLQERLSKYAHKSQLLPAVPTLLEMADYPAPDPVLKIRLDGLCTAIATSCLGLTTRLPGLKRVVPSGYLNSSPLSRRVLETIAVQNPNLRFPHPRFPGEVGAALVALAFEKEAQEREHLGKPPLNSGAEKKGLGEWGAPVELIRRLYRTRKPFEKYPDSVAK